VETCNMRLFHPPLGLSIFYGSRDQLRPGSLLHKRKEPGNEVVKTLDKMHQLKFKERDFVMHIIDK
jgi:hypothetical protein